MCLWVQWEHPLPGNTGGKRGGITIQAHAEDRGGVELTFSKAVPRVDVAVVNVHDVYTPVTHEVSLMAIALWIDTTVISGRGSQEGGI